MTIPDYEPLWRWIREREAVRIRKDLIGLPPPWTDDPILATYRFCNVRREDDRGTVWIRQHVRYPYGDDPMLWLMLCLCRQVNWPDTLAEVMTHPGAWPSRDRLSCFSPSNITRVLNARKARGDKVYTGAYMISAPATKGADKQAYVAEQVLGELWRRREEFAEFESGQSGSRHPPPTLQQTHAKICQSNGWGPFMAYQAVVDMRYTRLLDAAADRATWAAAGPGTIRGLNRLHDRAVDASLSQDQALREMRAIYEVAERETSVAMDFSDVPNVLCETDKYLRVRLGQGKPRAKYVPGRGA